MNDISFLNQELLDCARSLINRLWCLFRTRFRPLTL